jgi:hypothetical protein
MLKNFSKYVLFISVVFLIILQATPVSFAEQYGVLSGTIRDRNGDPISGVVIEVFDNYSKFVNTTISGADGKYVFSRLPIVSQYNADNFFIKANLEKNGKNYGSIKSEWLVVKPMMVTNKDIVFDNYPPSGIGRIYGVVSDQSTWLSSVPATIYLNNGMYAIYGGSTQEPFDFWLPEGDYQAWAERNVDGKTYISNIYNVHVTSDDSFYLLVYCPLVNNTTYREQPKPGINVVNGEVRQKNNAPLQDVYVELCTVSAKGNIVPVLNTLTDKSGKYEFKDVRVNMYKEDFAVRFKYSMDGKEYSKITDTFIIYAANTVGVPHTYTKNMIMDVLNSGSVFISTIPEGAYIWLDGINSTHRTPFNFTEIRVGSHEFRLVKEGYYDEVFTLNLEPDKTLTVQKTLKSNTGNVSFAISPSDAKVYINGEYAGDGSLKMMGKPAGKYFYHITREGYNNETGTFDIIPERDISINLNMVAIPGLSLTYISYLIGTVLNSIGKIFSG